MKYIARKKEARYNCFNKIDFPWPDSLKRYYFAEKSIASLKKIYMKLKVILSAISFAYLVRRTRFQTLFQNTLPKKSYQHKTVLPAPTFIQSYRPSLNRYNFITC